MQIKPLFGLAALALTAKANQEITVGKGGALDFSKSGGVAIAARAVPEANQAAHGPVAMGGAMDFSKSSKKQGKRAGPPGAPYPEQSTTCTEEDIPWIPEWTPGASFVWEAPEPPQTTPVVAVSSTSVLQKGQVVTSASSSSIAAISTTKVLPSMILSSLLPSASSSSKAFNVSTIAPHSSTARVTSTHVSSFTSTPSVVAPVTTHPVSSLAPSSSSIAIPSVLSSSSSHASSLTTPLPKAAGTSTTPTFPIIPIPTSSKSSISTSSVPTTSAPAAPATTSGPVLPFTHGPVTFHIVNSMPGSITISYQLGTYSPATGGATTVASSLVGPTATTGVFAKETTVVAPVGWAGRMTIGKAGAPLDYRGTKIEGNNGFDGADPNADPDPDVDISYVDGYSVPASCSCGAEVITGCNKELFDLGNKCTNLAGDPDHPVCVNDPRNIHGPASAFFAPCKAAAYTFDYDDVANWQGTCAGNTITCCIGTGCPSPDRQPKAKNKREMLALMSAEKRTAAAIDA